MSYSTSQLQAKDRVLIKRELRKLGVKFDNTTPTIELALKLKDVSPNFDFPVNIIVDLHEHEKVNNPKYKAEKINFVGSPLEFLLKSNSPLDKKTIENIQGLVDGMIFFLNDGWDKDSAIYEVLTKSSHYTKEVKALVLKTVFGK